MINSPPDGSQDVGLQRLVDLGMPLSLLVAVFIVWLVAALRSH